MNFIQRFFYGRNGTDQLNTVLLVAAFVCYLLAWLFGGFFGTIFSMAYTILLFLCIFRMLSRNMPKRQAENEMYLERTAGIRAKLPSFSRGGSSAARRPAQPTRPTRPTRPVKAKVKKDRANYRYLKCPGCKQPLRVPKGKGNIKIKCSKCSLEFIKKV